ncbi:MAG: SUMF1/EgtB/PvdO family nonheme iron enzyme [Bacteroidota bacterium]
MKAKQYVFIKCSLFILSTLILTSCQPERSKTTGWHYNSPESFGSGFEKFPAIDQETGPGLTFIEGGVFTMGLTEQDVMKDWNNNPRRVTVPSFYIDQTEVSNFDYLEYLFWLGRVYGSIDPGNPNGTYNPDFESDEEKDKQVEEQEAYQEQLDAEEESGYPNKKAYVKYFKEYKESFTSSYQEVFRRALPDTLCWRSPLGAMEHFVSYYLRHPAYKEYPVVGVSWIQANEYCKWRTDRVNEYILAREGILDWEMGNKELNAFQMFNTEAYLGGQYFGLQPEPKETNRYYISGEESEDEEEITDEGEEGEIDDDKKFTKKSESDNGRRLRNYNPSMRSTNKSGRGNYGARIVRMEDGILLPNYRLPTEAEWEYAAVGLIGNLQEGSENLTNRRTYPWNGHWVRREEEQFQGSMQANFMRTSGDYMGIAGRANDGAAPTAPVESYWPNDFGLFHMAGNVSEWVQDVYRPNSLDDVDGFSPFRGNVYTTKLTTTIGLHDAMKNDRVRYDVHGMKQYVLDFERVRYQRIAGSNGKETKGWNPLNADPYKKDDQQRFQSTGVMEDNIDFYYEYDIITTFKLDSLRYSFWSPSPKGFIYKNDPSKEKTNLKFTVDNKDFTVLQGRGDSSGMVRPKDVNINPGKYTVNVTLEDIRSGTNKKKYSYALSFNVLGKKPQNLDGINAQSRSKYAEEARQGSSPDPLYVSSGNSLDVFNVAGSQYKKELQFFDSINSVLDRAIHQTNNLRTTEASRTINNDLWGKVFDEKYIISLFPNYLDDPALTSMISILRNGLTEYIIETEGQMRYRNVTEEENIGRLNYRKDDYIDYLDGDVESSIFYQNENRRKDINLGKRDPKLVMYQSNHERYNLDGTNPGSQELTFHQGSPTTLVSDRTRVYKGGSWEDNAYWLGCHTRRFLDERQSTRNIGFRCAMDRVGSPTGKNYGKRKKRKS